MKQPLLASLLAVVPGLASAAERTVESPLSADRLIQLGLGMTVVIALIGATAFVLKRVMRVPTRSDGPVRVLGGVSMGARERVVLIEAGGERVLVGVVPGRIETLHVLSGGSNVASDAPDAPFAQALSAASTRTGG